MDKATAKLTATEALELAVYHALEASNVMTGLSQDAPSRFVDWAHAHATIAVAFAQIALVRPEPAETLDVVDGTIVEK